MSDSALRVDMSPAAVTQRLADLEDMFELARSLRTARVLGPIAEYPLEGTTADQPAPPTEPDRGSSRRG